MFELTPAIWFGMTLCDSESYPEGTKVCPACLNKGKVLRRILVYLQPYWKQTLVVWVLMLASSGLNFVGPLAMKRTSR